MNLATYYDNVVRNEEACEAANKGLLVTDKMEKCGTLASKETTRGEEIDREASALEKTTPNFYVQPNFTANPQFQSFTDPKSTRPEKLSDIKTTEQYGKSFNSTVNSLGVSNEHLNDFMLKINTPTTPEKHSLTTRLEKELTLRKMEKGVQDEEIVKIISIRIQEAAQRFPTIFIQGGAVGIGSTFKRTCKLSENLLSPRNFPRPRPPPKPPPKPQLQPPPITSPLSTPSLPFRHFSTPNNSQINFLQLQNFSFYLYSKATSRITQSPRGSHISFKQAWETQKNQKNPLRHFVKQLVGMSSWDHDFEEAHAELHPKLRSFKFQHLRREPKNSSTEKTKWIDGCDPREVASPLQHRRIVVASPTWKEKGSLKNLVGKQWKLVKNSQARSRDAIDFGLDGVDGDQSTPLLISSQISQEAEERYRGWEGIHTGQCITNALLGLGPYKQQTT